MLMRLGGLFATRQHGVEDEAAPPTGKSLISGRIHQHDFAVFNRRHPHYAFVDDGLTVAGLRAQAINSLIVRHTLNAHPVRCP